MEMATGRKLKGIHVFLMLAAFFGVMFAVNGVFVYMALTSFSGVSVDDSYKKGLNYNQEISRLSEQQARGWQTGLTVDTMTDNRISVILSVLDQEGQSLEGLKAVLLVRRPARSDQDRQVVLTRSGSQFKADMQLASPGQWDLAVQITGGGYETPYRMEKRIWVK
ncbi:MAG: FixH family protein [Sneathiella sp.]